VKKYDSGLVEKAPVLIVVVVNPKKGGMGSYFGQKFGALQAGAACVQNMMLAAADMGLGTLWFTFFDPDLLRPVLDIPEEFPIVGVIPVGKPTEPMKTPPRKDPKIYHQRYGKTA
jgi:nitroreductase